MRLGSVIRAWREQNRYGVREAAKLMGVSHATLSRIERGENMDGEVLAKLLRWLLSNDVSFHECREK